MAKSSSFDRENTKSTEEKVETPAQPVEVVKEIPVVESAKIEENITQTAAQSDMTETKEIRIIFEKPTQIEFIMQNNGDRSPRILHDQKISLSKSTIYKLPITDKNISLQTAYVIRPTSKFAELIRILNIENGFVTIEPIIHGTTINNNDLIGNLI